MTRTKAYNQTQREQIEELRHRIAERLAVPDDHAVVDFKRTPHTFEAWKAGHLPRFGIRNKRQIETYGFYVVKK